MITLNGISKSYFVKDDKSVDYRNILSRSISPKKSEHKALDNVTFTIQPGETVGFIGPNGAGKSTTIKIMSGILVPTSGQCTIHGRVPWLDRRKHVERLGVVFGNKTQLWWDLPVIDSFDLVRDMYRIQSFTYKNRLRDLVKVLDIEQVLKVPVKQLSLGMRMRCDLAAALLHEPDVLFLDEPTIGLDALSKLSVRNFIQNLSKQNKMTIFLTTHDLEDIEALCRRVLLIHTGKLLLDESFPGFRNRLGIKRIIRFDLDSAVSGMDHEFTKNIGMLGFRVLTDIATGQIGHIDFEYNPETTSGKSIIEFMNQRFSIKDLIIENESIDAGLARFYKNDSIH